MSTISICRCGASFMLSEAVGVASPVAIVCPSDTSRSSHREGKYAQNGNGQATSRGQKIPDRSFQIAKTVGEIAQELGRSSSQIALAWIRAQSPQMIPILGASKLEQLQDNLKCLEVTLSPEQLQKLDRVSQIERGFPHDFLDSEMLRGNLFGSTYDSITLR